MLDDYNNIQPIVYRILSNVIKNETLSHAYLFETNGFSNSQELIMSFVKSLLCPNKYLNNKNCGNCHQCEVIESGNFPEIKIINPDGLWIKKNQLQELQTEFGEKALIGNKRIYIINNADRLNTSAANSILKFLEEPEEGIIAILVTENTSGILETIKSRCQIIRLKKDKITKDKSYIETIKKILIQNKSTKENDEDQLNEKIEKVINFINYYENHHLDTIIFMQKLWHDYIKTKDDMLDAFDIMIMYYRDILNIKVDNNTEIFEKTKDIEKIIQNNNAEDICKKINILIDKKNNIKSNANTKLLMI